MVAKWAYGRATAVAASGSYAYLGTGGVLQVADVSDTGTLTVVGEVVVPYRVEDIAIAGNHLFIANWAGGVRIIDVSTPAAPVEVAVVELPGSIRGVTVLNGIAYAAADDAGLHVVDVSTAASPGTLATVSLDGNSMAVAVAGGHAYVAALSGGLRVVDVSTPDAPVEVGFFDTPDWAFGVAVHGNLAVVSDYPGSLLVLDVSDPAAPTQAGSVGTTGGSNMVVVSNGLAYMGDTETGVSVLDLSGCGIELTYWLEIAAHLEGENDSLWLTDVVARNDGTNEAMVELVLHTSEGDESLSNAIPPAAQGVFEDVVDLLGTTGKGSLEIRSSQPLIVSGRIFNQADSGTFGQFLDGYTTDDGLASGDSAWLLQLRQLEGAYRTNISITNTGSVPASVRITLFASDGTELERYSRSVEPFAVFQDLQPIARRANRPDLGWGFAKIEVLEGNGVLASASVVDAITNDATTIPARR